MWTSTKMLQQPYQREFLIPTSPNISPLAIEAVERRACSVLNPASTAWPTANLGLLFQFVLETSFTAASFFVLNGATVSGNFDMAILAARVGSDTVDRVASTGSTAQSGTSNWQFVSSAFTLPPGTYYAELIFDNTTATVRGQSAPNASVLGSFGSAQVANGTLVIPATQVLETPTATLMPMFGISVNTGF